MSEKTKPIIYSCSGCSSAAQMANYVAVKVDRSGAAEMSCIAGVGGDVKSLVMKAKSSRPIVALDGCPLKCVESCLKRHGIKPDAHIVLSDFKISKKYHEDFNKEEADGILEVALKEIKKMTPS